MKLDRSSFAETPERILDATVDCIWVVLSERPKPSPFRSHALEWLDWKLGGRLSRTLFDEASRPGTQSWYLPTMKRIKAPYVAMSMRREEAAAELAKTARGLNWQKVLLFFEDPLHAPDFERSLRGLSNYHDLPSSLCLTLGSDRKLPGPERDF